MVPNSFSYESIHLVAKLARARTSYSAKVALERNTLERFGQLTTHLALLLVR
jgi:hypothetical protein